MLRDHRTRFGLRLLLAVLVVMGGLGRGVNSFATSAGPDATQLLIIEALGGTLCHKDADQPEAPTAPHKPDCAVCPFCTALGAPAAVVAGGTALPAPVILPPEVVRIAVRVRAPPPIFSVAQPRAPPTQT